MSFDVDNFRRESIFSSGNHGAVSMIVSAGWRRRRRSREQPPSPHILLSWSSYRVANNEGGRGRRGETMKEGRFLRSAELFSSWLLARCSVGMSLGMGAPSVEWL